MMLAHDEAAFFSLRELYMSKGYRLFRVSRFEEYDFYADKKDFLPSKHILTFTDADGRLMALRPDVTLSVIKNAEEGKYFYRENVYRVPENGSSFREISQSGIEFIGAPDVAEVLSLAVMSLEVIADGRNYVLDVADAGIVSGLIHGKQGGILRCLTSKNIHGLKELGADERLIELAMLDGSTDDGCPFSGDILHAMRERGHCRVDFSCVNNLSYYSGIVFKGYVDGVPCAVLSGGEYRIMGVHGAGMAVYLNNYGGSCYD